MMPFGGATELQLHPGRNRSRDPGAIEAASVPWRSPTGVSWMAKRACFACPGGAGDVGFISSVTNPFCAACTRARLTADGRLRLCLLRDGEVDLLTPLRPEPGWTGCAD